MIRVAGESRKEIRSYTIQELEEHKVAGKSIVCSVVKCTMDDTLIVDLGNGIVGEIPIDKFEDSPRIVSKSALIDKVGKIVEALVVDIQGDKVILDRAKLQRVYKEHTLKKVLTPGMILDTYVVSIAPFGLFVELGVGVIALLPIDDISISRLSSIKDVFKPGQEIKVVFRSEQDGQYVVSHKELLGTWDENVSDFGKGEIVQGIVRDIKDYGVFIEIAPNLSGLADKPDFAISLGDSVRVLIKSSQKDKMKLKLHLIGKTEIPYRISYKYKVVGGTIKHWVYSPYESDRLIETKF